MGGSNSTPHQNTFADGYKVVKYPPEGIGQMTDTPDICAAENTDRELWREIEGDYYANSIHVTLNGGIGINVGGYVIVQPLASWHTQAAHIARLTSALERAPVVVLEQRCERGTPWDLACVSIAAKMKAHVDATLEALAEDRSND